LLKATDLINLQLGFDASSIDALCIRHRRYNSYKLQFEC